MPLTRKTMPETMYRASRCCRVLGNPTAYLLLRSLGKRRKTPTELSEESRVPLPTVSMTLRHLRQLDLVRYETSGATKTYWIKDTSVLNLLDSLEAFIETMRERQA